MKQIIIASILFFVLFSCGNNTKTQNKQVADSSISMFFGEKINEEGAISMSEIASKMGTNTEMKLKIKGEVDNVCQKKGCWMNIKNPTGESMNVSFKDYGFFMPMDCAGKTAIIEGVASLEETSIERLKELARDEKQPKEIVDAITKTKRELVFEAFGVILK